MAKTLAAAFAATLLATATPALAVGYEPVHLNQRQATAVYRQLRFLLAGDFHCPPGQVPRSGLVTGGDSGMTGVQRTVITFDKGAKLRLVQNWSHTPAGRSITVQMSCP